jgi:HTH-type transcriptional regulator / antitoxin HipB
MARPLVREPGQYWHILMDSTDVPILSHRCMLAKMCQYWHNLRRTAALTKPLTWQIRSGADLGRSIADLRGRQGMTQSELAVRVGLSRDYLAKIEGGRTVSLLEHSLRILRRMGATVTISWEPDDGPA